MMVAPRASQESSPMLLHECAYHDFLTRSEPYATAWKALYTNIEEWTIDMLVKVSSFLDVKCQVLSFIKYSDSMQVIKVTALFLKSESHTKNIYYLLSWIILTFTYFFLLLEYLERPFLLRTS